MSIIVVMVFATSSIKERGGLPEDAIAFNSENYLITIGYCIYSFEGIGVVMPIMQSCAEPEKFLSMFYAAMATLTTIYIVYGTYCSVAYD